MCGRYLSGYNIVDFGKKLNLRRKYMLYKDQYKNTLEQHKNEGKDTA